MNNKVIILLAFMLLGASSILCGQNIPGKNVYAIKLYSTQYLFLPKVGNTKGDEFLGAFGHGLTFNRISLAFQIQNPKRHLHEIELRGIGWSNREDLFKSKDPVSTDTLYLGIKQRYGGILVRYTYMLPFFTKPDSKWQFHLGFSANPYFYMFMGSKKGESYYYTGNPQLPVANSENERFNQFYIGISYFTVPTFSYFSKGIFFGEISMPIPLANIHYRLYHTHYLDTGHIHSSDDISVTPLSYLYALRLGLGIRIR